MGTQAVVNLLAVGEASPVSRRGVSEHYALRVITSGTNEFWFLGDPEDAQKVYNVDPGADIRKAALARVPDYQEDGGFISGNISIGSGSYSLADVDHDGAEAFAERFANRQSLRGAVLVLYQADDDGDFTEDTRIRTSLGRDMRDDEGELIITFESIHTLIRGKLFSPQKLRLAMSISESGESSGETIVIQVPENTTLAEGYVMPRFKHDDAYSVDPGKTICYWKTSENEVISTVVAKAVEADGMLVFPVHQRGLFGTKKKGVAVDLAAVPATYPEIEEFIFLEENPGDMLLLTLAGETADGRVPPPGSNYTKNLGKALFNLASFDYTASLMERQHFAGLAEQDTKTFVDKRVLGEVFATLLDDVHGRFDFRTRASFADDGLSVEVLDENNLSLDDGLVFETLTDNLRRVIFIKHGYNSITKSYEMADIRISTDTLPTGVYGELDDIDIEYQGWNTAVGTISQLYTRAAIVQDLHHAPMLKTVVHLLPNMNHVRVGDIVTLDTRRIRTVYNSLSGEPVAVPPWLSMLVVAREGRSESRTTSLALVASTGSVERTSTTAQDQVLSDEEYDRIAPTLLSSIVTPTAGTGGRELYSGEHMVPGNKWYRIDNKAILGVDFKLKPVSPCEYIGIAHKDDLSVLSTVGAIDGKNYGAYDGTTSVEGNPGAIGLTAADGGIDVVFRTDVSNSGGTHTMKSFPQQGGIRGTLDTFTGLNLLMMGNQLRGLPRRAAGSGGQGGGRVTGKLIDASGSGYGVDVFNQDLGNSPAAAKGGRGGMGAFYLGRRLAWSANAVLFDVSGGDGATGQHVVGGAVSGSGAGGAPGLAGIIVDGNHSIQPLKEENVRAFNGVQISFYAHFDAVVSRGNVTTFKQSYYQGTPRLNRWRSNTAVTFIPANDSVGDRPLNAFDQLAADEAGLDGKITLHLIPDTPDPVFPRNADVNDIAAYEVDARNLDLAITSVRVYRLTSSGWKRIEFPDIIAEFKLTAFRDRGSTVLWVRDTRPPIGVYAIGDSWYHPGSRRMYILGASADGDVLVSSDSFSDFTGFNLLVDPNWVDYASGMDTLAFHQRWDEALRTEDSAPTTPVAEALGQTSASYIAVGAAGFDYEENGAVMWEVSGAELVSSAGDSSGNARAFYGGTAGFLADSDPRKIWVYARATGGSKTLIVQAAGASDAAGTPSQQQSVTISATANTWVLMPGLFGAYHSQMQLRTNDENLYVSRVIAIDQDSVSVPYGENGFGSAGSGGIVAARPFWAPPTTDDRKYPLKRGSSRGPFQLLDSGEGNSLAWRVDFSGASVPNIIVERFPWKAKPGTQYRATIRMRIKVSNGFSNPSRMGVSAQIEGYDDTGKLAFTTSVQSGDASDWFSVNGSAFTDLVQIVDVPKTVSRLAWGALKVVVLGDASGYAEIDSCEMVELPYRVREYFAEQLNYYGIYDNDQTRITFFWTIPMSIKKGMRVQTSVEGEARTDQIDSGNQSPSLSLGGVFRSIDLFGNSVNNVLTYPEVLKHRTGGAYFAPRLSASTIPSSPNQLSTTYQAFSSSTDFVAWADIDQLSMRFVTARGSNISSDLFLKGLTVYVNYGEKFGDIG